MGARGSTGGGDVVYRASPAKDSPPAKMKADIQLRFPFVHIRETFLFASHWNARINAIYTFLEGVSKQLSDHPDLPELPYPEQPYPERAEECEKDRERETEREGSPAQATTMAVVAETGETGTGTGTAGTGGTGGTGGVGTSVGTGALVGALGTVTTGEASPDPLSRPVSVAIASPAVPVPLPLHVHAHAPEDREAPSFSSPASLSESQPPEKNKTPTLDKVSRITKAISRFLVMGNKEAVADLLEPKFFVPLGQFGLGRVGLKPGRRGEVIPVEEDEFGTIIAYSLASSEYHDSLQESLLGGGQGAGGDSEDLGPVAHMGMG
ncbi:hypothetical protein B484DRAFT_393439, partial [Ochromonadaceae sp. CCMP2298]